MNNDDSNDGRDDGRDDDLLRPTLSDYSRPPAMYHTTGFALSAFFGGPVGAAIYAMFNTARLSRLKQDGVVVLALCAAAVLVALQMARSGGLDSLASVAGLTQQSTARLMLRALGLACFGAIYLLHRKFFRAARISGVKPAPSWPLGLASVALGWAANVAMMTWILEHH